MALFAQKGQNLSRMYVFRKATLMARISEQKSTVSWLQGYLTRKPAKESKVRKDCPYKPYCLDIAIGLLAYHNKEDNKLHLNPTSYVKLVG
jgi:hypothetical protein